MFLNQHFGKEVALATAATTMRAFVASRIQ
jgi:hypothetical protein